jgi:hypothetical protein
MKPLIGRFFVDWLLPDTSVYLARIRSGAAAVMAVPG